MATKYHFVCMAASKGSRTHGHFYKGQKVVINESDPRLPWFRSGGFKQVRIEGTPGIMGSPAPAQTVKSNDAPKMYLSEELKSLLSENPKVGAAQLAVLEKAGLTTAEKVMTAGIDAATGAADGRLRRAREELRSLCLPPSVACSCLPRRRAR